MFFCIARGVDGNPSVDPPLWSGHLTIHEIKFGTDIHDAQWMDPTDFEDPLALP